MTLNECHWTNTTTPFETNYFGFNHSIFLLFVTPFVPSFATRDVFVVELASVVGCLAVDCTDGVGTEGGDVEVVKPVSPSEFSRRPTYKK